MDNKKRALGKGLEQLFSNEVIDFNNFEKEVVENTKSSDIVLLNVDEIRSNPYQPRTNFDEESLNELADSIKEHGIIQPIIVKKSIKGYELIAGERRTKASKIAGITKIPAIIRELTDTEMMEIALIENIQRENLNAIEEAKAIANIIKIEQITQDEFARKFGKSRSYVTNLLGLLKLPRETKKLVETKQISMGHARVLSKLEDETEIIKYSNLIVDKKISVRDLERMLQEEPLTKKRPMIKKVFDNHYTIYQNVMRDKIGTKVKINKNKIEIPFDSKGDLERIMEILDIKIEGD